jgi:hypothetical protein
MMHGPTTHSSEWQLGIVSSVTREGKVKAADASAQKATASRRFFNDRDIRNSPLMYFSRLTKPRSPDPACWRHVQRRADARRPAPLCYVINPAT